MSLKLKSFTPKTRFETEARVTLKWHYSNLHLATVPKLCGKHFAYDKVLPPKCPPKREVILIQCTICVRRSLDIVSLTAAVQEIRNRMSGVNRA